MCVRNTIPNTHFRGFTLKMKFDRVVPRSFARALASRHVRARAPTVNFANMPFWARRRGMGALKTKTTVFLLVSCILWCPRSYSTPKYRPRDLQNAKISFAALPQAPRGAKIEEIWPPRVGNVLSGVPSVLGVCQVGISSPRNIWEQHKRPKTSKNEPKSSEFLRFVCERARTL